MLVPSKTIFYSSISDEVACDGAIMKPEAERLYNIFKSCKLFRWSSGHNDCEDRANAISILLDAWGVRNYKAWVFSGYFLRKNLSSLINRWNYHVAAALPVNEDGEIKIYVIDPSTSQDLITIAEWAEKITETPFSYHVIKTGDIYIFNTRKIEKDNWHKRDKRNRRWTMQGLTGINGVSTKGRAQLSFNKRWVKRTEAIFAQIERRAMGEGC